MLVDNFQDVVTILEEIGYRHIEGGDLTGQVTYVHERRRRIAKLTRNEKGKWYLNIK